MRTSRLTRFAWSLTAAMLFVTTAQAMEIQQFDKMASQDRSDYVACLVIGAQKVLIDEGRRDLADQVDKLFTKILAGDEIPLGMVEFTSNLDLLRVNDAEHAQKNPKDPRIEVEDVLFITLKKNHIDLPDSFFTVAKDFKPKHPLQNQ